MIYIIEVSSNNVYNSKFVSNSRMWFELLVERYETSLQIKLHFDVMSEICRHFNSSNFEHCFGIHFMLEFNF